MIVNLGGGQIDAEMPIDLAHECDARDRIEPQVDEGRVVLDIFDLELQLAGERLPQKRENILASPFVAHCRRPGARVRRLARVEIFVDALPDLAVADESPLVHGQLARIIGLQHLPKPTASKALDPDQLLPRSPRQRGGPPQTMFEHAIARQRRRGEARSRRSRPLYSRAVNRISRARSQPTRSGKISVAPRAGVKPYFIYGLK